jgi:hypothetical protein
MELLIELHDETREGGVGLFHNGNTVESEPDGQTALQGFPQTFNTSLNLRASCGNKSAAGLYPVG